MDSAGHAFPPVPCPLLVPQCHGVPPAFLLTSSPVLFSLSACSCSLLSSLGHLLLIASKRRAYRSQVYISSHGLSLWLQRWVHLSSHGCATRASNTTHLVIPIVPSASDSWVFYRHHFPRMQATLSTTPTSSDYSPASFFFFFFKGPDRKYFRLCKSYYLCCNCLTLPLYQDCVSVKLFTKTDFCSDLACPAPCLEDGYLSPGLSHHSRSWAPCCSLTFL